MTKNKGQFKKKINWEKFVYCENEVICDIKEPKCENCSKKKFEDTIEQIRLFNIRYENKYRIRYNITPTPSMFIAFEDIRTEFHIIIFNAIYLKNENDIYNWIDKFEGIIAYVKKLRHEVIDSIKEIF
jgi:hypothetical protein